MNPVDNNSNTNPGTGAPGGFGPAPAPAVGGMGDPSGFSATDSLDPLKTDAGSTTKPEGEKAADDSKEALDVPEAPFVPASPAPGSIGSVTSGPTAGGTTNLAAAVAPSGADGSAAFAPVGDTNPTMPPVGDTNDLIAQAAKETPAVSAPFNPFAPAAEPAANNPTASTTPNAAGTAPNNTSAGVAAMLGEANATAGAPNGQVASANPFAPVNAPAGNNPAGNPTLPGQGTSSPFQAKMESLAKEQRPAAGKSSNILTIVLAGVGAIAAIAAIIFCVLWRQAVSNPEIRYVPAPSTGGESANANSSLICQKMYGAGEVAGMDNLVNGEATLTLNFTGDELQNSSLSTVYNFTDESAANAASEGIFAAMTSSMALNNDAGETIVATSSQPLGDRVEYREDTDVTLLDSASASGRNLPQAEDGSVQRDRASVEAFYAEQGWTCQ